ncbi:Protein MCM10 homolog [Sergentomyia squamirostris]
MSTEEPVIGLQNDDPELDELEQQLLQICDEDPIPGTSKTFDFLSQEQSSGKEDKEKLDDRILSDKLMRERIGNESDSSDDEEVKNFLERKYNEYGRDIALSLKKKNEERKLQIVELEVQKNIRGCDQLKVIPQLPPINSAKYTVEQFAERQQLKIQEILNKKKEVPVYRDPVFGMRLVKPLVSGQLLQEKMKDKITVTMINMLRYSLSTDKTRDWVFAGVIVTKSPVKTTQKGKQFSIWTLTDLKRDMKTCTLFLFEAAHRDLWKTPVGMAMAVLNASVMERRDSKTEASLSINTAEKVMLLGQSKDLGTCRSRKKNGEPCTSIVNLDVCDHCVFHMKKEYTSLSKRSEFQSATSGRGLNELRNKVLGKNEVFYAGQSFSALPAKKNPKQVEKDSKRLLSLSEYFGRTTGSAGNSSTPTLQKNRILRAEAVAEVSVNQRRRDLERLEKLKNTPGPSASSQPSTSSGNQAPKAIFSSQTPTLSKSSFSIDLHAKSSVLARAKAAEILKKAPLEKSNPNFVKYRGTDSGKKRVLEEMNQELPSAKRAKLQEQEKKDRIQKIMAATTSHMDLVDRREMEETNKHLNTLEKKEALEEKMLSTFKVACKAVACKICKYLAFSASPFCLEQRHPLKVIETDKRFFKCGDCGNRTATVHRIPKYSCKNCQSSRWEPTAMIKERIVQSATEKLSIRGDEETYIGSSTSGNLNLLVPDEEVTQK